MIEHIDKRSKILFGILFAGIIASAALTFYRLMVLKDYSEFTEEDQIPAEPLDFLTSTNE